MTPSEVEKLAREAGAGLEQWMTNPPKPAAWWLPPDALIRFAELIERAAMEKAAKIAEADMDLFEEDHADKAARLAAKRGDADDELRRLRHASTVSLYNGALRKAAAAIRAAAQKEAT